MSSPFDIDQSIKDYIKRKYSQDGPSSVEEIVQYLRDKGITQLPTVFLLVGELGVPFTKANEYVCKCWSV